MPGWLIEALTFSTFFLTIAAGWIFLVEPIAAQELEEEYQQALKDAEEYKRSLEQAAIEWDEMMARAQKRIDARKER